MSDFFQAQIKAAKNINVDLTLSVEKEVNKKFGENYFPLRFYISDVTAREFIVEAVVANSRFQTSAYLKQVESPARKRSKCAVSLIPTGIQASFGGWAGDATPVTKLLAKTVPHLIVNPNALNASHFIDIPENIIYAEGSQIDMFMRGQVDFSINEPIRLGVIVEKTSAANLAMVQCLIDTARMLGGVDIVGVMVTDEEVGSKVAQTPSGAYVGTISNPDELLRCANKLKSKGANAIAVTTLIRGYDEKLYLEHFSGNHPNPIGGVETIISHLLVKNLGLPAAHGPLVNYKPSDKNMAVDPRSAGEFVSPCGLYCILRGLAQAPQFEFGKKTGSGENLNAHDVVAVVAPGNAMGGVPVLEAHRQNIPVIGVMENSTILNVTADRLNLTEALIVNSYLEAAGLVSMLATENYNVDQLRKMAASRAGLAQINEFGQVAAKKARVSAESISRAWATPEELRKAA